MQYEWSGRTIKYHRAQIREASGFASRPARMRTSWRAGSPTRYARASSARSASATALLGRCREERLEPPGRIGRLLGSARRLADERFCARTVARLEELAVERLEELVAEDEPDSSGQAVGGGPGLFAELRADPGPPGLESLLCEIARLERVRAIGLPADLFSEADEKRVALWRARAAAEHPSWLRAHPREVRLTLLACFCWSRITEITDSLVDLLLGVVHKMGARADYRVEQELVADLKPVRGKRGILFALADAAVEHPDDTVRRAIFPVVGEQTLRELVREAQANDRAFRAQVRKVLRSSYSNHYRRMLPPVLEALQFRCNNTAYRPLIRRARAVAPLRASRAGPVLRPGRPRADRRGGQPDWREAVVDERGRVERIPYELCVLTACATRSAAARSGCRAPAAGATPRPTFPSDFEPHREIHYAAISQPLDPTAFIASSAAIWTRRSVASPARCARTRRAG